MPARARDQERAIELGAMRVGPAISMPRSADDVPPLPPSRRTSRVGRKIISAGH